ncbi:serine/threonine-protein phosphatase 6 regulatory ankyrin repeat subunit C-like [Actinia tenebrosa]|uniref:Serine/threonine-protein phosphatase 6 regulatory ankyrin repeat subunit C-like n=1 Tax=Actinia tenebrosa TaxID=6105 RepID=A0A6P8HKS1_ACTTE|nr:serine/threonine-protein phosphatase 6 regulatory ankyrin repeat subunit C-like [Actinia tenebrosa]
MATISWPRRRVRNVKRIKHDHHQILNRAALDSQLLTSVLVSSSALRIRSLISRGANVNCSNSFGYTPLLLALSRDGDEQSIHAVSELCEAGADVNLSSDVFYGDTPLHFACMLKSSVFARILIANNANVRARNHAGYTPLHTAALRGNLEIVKLLCLNGADIDATETYCGYTPLHLAANGNHDDAMILLAEGGANVLQRDFQGLTPIDRCQSTNTKIILDRYTIRPKRLEEICVEVIRHETGKFSGIPGYDRLPLPRLIRDKIQLDF